MAAAAERDVIAVETAVTLDGLFPRAGARTPICRLIATAMAGNTSRAYSWSRYVSGDRALAKRIRTRRHEGWRQGRRHAAQFAGMGDVRHRSARPRARDRAAVHAGPSRERGLHRNDAECKVLLIESEEQWGSVGHTLERVPGLVRLLTVKSDRTPSEHRVVSLQAWLAAPGAAVRHETTDPHALATIVYTSGTTGRPKGVMLSHRNVLSNVHACLTGVTTTRHEDVFLSFLPLSHTFERTCGYYCR